MLNEPHLATAQSDGILALDTDMRAPLKALRVGFEPVQDLHGYDKPWPGGGGKNKLDQSAYTTLEKATFSNGKFTSNYAYPPLNTMVRTFLNGSTVKSILSSITVGTRTSLTITVDSTWDSMFIGLRTSGVYNAGAYFAKPSVDDGTYTVSFYVDSATSGDMAFSNVQLEEGSTATAWAPYSNICPITGWDGVNVQRTGKNRLRLGDIKTSNAGTKDKSDNAVTVYSSNTAAGFRYARFAVLDVEPYKGQRITFTAQASVVKGISTPRIIARLYSADGATIGGNFFELTGTTFSRSFVLPSEIPSGAFLGLTLYSDSNNGGEHEINYFNLQLEVGADATAYEPYSGSTVPVSWIDAAGTVYKGHAIINRDGSATVTATMASVDAGTLTWGAYDAPFGKCFYGTPPRPKQGWRGLSSDYVQHQIGFTQIENGEFTTGSGAGYAAFVRDDRYASGTAAKFKAAMKGVQFVYQLATPVTYTLTQQEVLRTLRGENNLWSDANGAISATFWKH